jgi:hypothetical protein
MQFPKCKNTCALVLAAALGVALTGVVNANKLVQPQVSGQVTSVNGSAAITINGQTYLISSSSPAYQQIQGVHIGDQIGLVLNGPAGASTTQVVGIVTTGATSKASSASHQG